MENRLTLTHAVVGEYTQVQEDAFALTLAGTSFGTTVIFNTNTDSVRVWNGTAFEDIHIATPTSLGQGTPTRTTFLDGQLNWTEVSTLAVDLTSAQTIAGVKTFSDVVQAKEDIELTRSLKVGPTVGAQILTNGGFENWSSNFTLTDWTAFVQPVIRSTDCHSGNYSVHLLGLGSDIMTSSVVGTVVSDLNVGDEYDFSIWAKSTLSGTDTLFVLYLILDSTTGDILVQWNFVTKEWDPVSGGSDAAPTSFYYFPVLTNSWTLYDTTDTEVIVPSGGTFAVLVGSNSSEVFIDDASMILSSGGSNILLDPSFENWTTGPLAPTGWITSPDPPIGLTRETVRVHSGQYAISSTGDEDGNQTAIIQERRGLTPGDLYRFSLWTASDAYESWSASFIVEGSIAAPVKIWNFVTNTWDVYSGGPSYGEIFFQYPTNIYQEFVSSPFSIPASGDISIITMLVGSPGYPSYFDDFGLHLITDPTDATLFDCINASDANNLADCDQIFNFRTSGGTPKSHFNMTADGKFHTDNANFDFSEKPLLSQNLVTETFVGVSTIIDIAAPFSNATVAIIPDGKKYVHSACYCVTEPNGSDVVDITNTPQISLGKNSGPADLVVSCDIGIKWPNSAQRIDYPQNTLSVVNGPDTITVSPIILASGGSSPKMNCRFYLFGWFLP